MKENFDRAFLLVIGAEGVYSNDPDDKGGETKFGITKRSYPKLDIKNLTIEQAKSIYKSDYWDKIKADALPDKLDIVMFDCAVNQGVSTAIKLQSGSWQDFIMHRIKNYSLIVQNNPAQIKFLRGWVNRCVNLWEKLEA